MFQGDFVKMVPEKWEPGQRAAVVKHKDNLVGLIFFIFFWIWDFELFGTINLPSLSHRSRRVR